MESREAHGEERERDTARREREAHGEEREAHGAYRERDKARRERETHSDEREKCARR